MEKQHRDKCYVLLTTYQRVTDRSPTVSRLLADCWSVFWPKPIGRPSADRWPTGCFGSCSSQLPRIISWEWAYRVKLAAKVRALVGIHFSLTAGSLARPNHSV